MIRNIHKNRLGFVCLISLLSVVTGFSTNVSLPCEAIMMRTSSNVTFERSKRGADLDLLLDKPLPLPSEVLDNLFSRRLFNTTMNYIVPCFEVTLPLRTEDGNTIHLAMQAFLGLFSAIAWIATVAIPLILTEFVPFGFKKRDLASGSSRDSKSYFEYEFPLTKLEPLFNKHVAKKIGLEWDVCFRKTICQAHRDPKKYGILAIPFVTIFLPQNNVINQENQAAYVGRATQQECGMAYHCFFDVLDLAQYLYQAFWKRKYRK